MSKQIYSESIFIDSDIPEGSEPIPGCPGYRADKEGRIWSCRYNKGLGHGRGTISVYGPWKEIKGTDANGYLQTGVRTSDGKWCSRFVHRLILETFVGPRPEGKQTRHLNSNPRDNRLVNLRWGTAKENDNDKEKVGTHCRGEKNGKAK